MDKFLKLMGIISNVVIIITGASIIFIIAPSYLPNATTSMENNVVSGDDIDATRQILIKKWASAGLTNVKVVIEEGERILSEETSTIDQLKLIAKKANSASNYVGFIQEEYENYYKENYKYQFIQNQVAKPHDQYVKVTNKLRNIRDTAFLKIAQKLESTGDIGTAFFYYRDAFRLSGFDDYTDSDPGIRYTAEQAMKNILGIDNIQSYKSWK